MELQVLWFIVLGVLLGGYGVLDGFDLGVGIVHLAARGDKERRLLMNAIGPLWDGNEVWLVTFGGALFAGFPEAYATAFSTFYLPFMALLWALIFRGVSMEFRSKRTYGWWRSMWDVSFSLASGSAAFLFGMAVGNALLGLPIGADFEFTGELKTLFRPYPILAGGFVVAACAMHGCAYLLLKTEGGLQKRIELWLWRAFGLFLSFYLLVTTATLVKIPSVTKHFGAHPGAWVVVLANVLAIANIPRSIVRKTYLQGFLSSAACMLCLTFLFGIALFPNLLTSTTSPKYSLTIYNASSSQATLRILRNIAAMATPMVLSYTGLVYWVFRGKVRLDKNSY